MELAIQWFFCENILLMARFMILSFKLIIDITENIVSGMLQLN